MRIKLIKEILELSRFIIVLYMDSSTNVINIRKFYTGPIPNIFDIS